LIFFQVSNTFFGYGKGHTERREGLTEMFQRLTLMSIKERKFFM